MLQVIAAVRCDMERDTQVGRLANRSIGQTVPTSKVAGRRILPMFVLILEQSLFEIRMKFVIMFHMPNDETLDGCDRDVQLEPIIDPGFPNASAYQILFSPNLVVDVPEPSSLALCGIVAAVIFGFARRSRRSRRLES